MTNQKNRCCSCFCKKAGNTKEKNMKTISTICVYCGSSTGRDPNFTKAAQDLGRLMAENEIGLVYGGGRLGLMGEIAGSVVKHGGHVTGIIPDFLRDREQTFEGVQEIVVVPDMHTRKRMMFEKADAFVAMPGGIGTLEELVEQMTWAQLGRHTKPILMLSINGFWRPLLSLCAYMREQGFIRPNLELNYMVAEQSEDVIPMLQKAAEKTENGSKDAWIKEKF